MVSGIGCEKKKESKKQQKCDNQNTPVCFVSVSFVFLYISEIQSQFGQRGKFTMKRQTWRKEKKRKATTTTTKKAGCPFLMSVRTPFHRLSVR